MLNQRIEKNRLMPSIQVFLDCSGRAATLTVPGLHFTREKAESIALNNVRGGAGASPSQTQYFARGVQRDLRSLRGKGNVGRQNPWSAWERPGDRVRLARTHLVCVYFGSFWRPINQRWPMMAGGLGTRGPGG